MARILYLTHILPYPLNTGAKIRQYYVLRQLCQRHSITLVSFVRQDDRPENVDHLKRFCESVYTVPIRRSKFLNVRAAFKSEATQQPFYVVRDDVGEMRRVLKHLWSEQRFDAVHADQIAMAQYGLMGAPRVGRVLDMHNAMHAVGAQLAQNQRNPIKRFAAQREARALGRYEVELCQKFDQVVFVAEEDRKLVEQLANRLGVSIPPGRLSTIPICVDPIDRPPILPSPRAHRVTALGEMLWPPNAEGVGWFAEKVWPRVRASFPEAVLTIVGKNPPEYLWRLNQKNNIEVTGFVANIVPILAETAAFIAPLRAGGGMRVKILDMWCRGLPIVSTRIGAEGIEVSNQKDILLADGEEEFALAVMRVLSNKGLNRALRLNGRSLVTRKYDWRNVYQAWEDLYAVLGSGRTPNSLALRRDRSGALENSIVG